MARGSVPAGRGLLYAAVAALLLAVVLGGFGQSFARAAESPGKGLVYAEGERLMLDGQPFVMKGYNYYPRDYGWTAIADWDWKAVDTEFALARQYGANTIRTGNDYPYLTGDPYGEDPSTHCEVLPENLEGIERLLSTAERHGLKVIFTLGPSWGTSWDPKNFWMTQKQIESLVPRFAGDPRIAAWDLATDLDGSMLQPPPPGGYGVDPHADRESMVTLLRNMAGTVRELDPAHLLTVGFCWPSSSLLVQDFTDFLMPQFLGADAPNILTSDEAARFEDYAAWVDYTLDPEAAVDGLAEKIHSLRDRLRRPMPIVLGEYGSPSAGEGYSEGSQAVVYEAVLETVFLRGETAGALNWALVDFNWPPKAFTLTWPDGISPEEQSFGIFDVEYRPKPSAEVARAYYADRPEIALETGSSELGFVFATSFVPAESHPGSDDTRELCAAFDWIEFRDTDDKALLRLDVGTTEARPYLAKGFYADEGPWARDADNFAWAGGSDREARVYVEFPEGTASVAFRAYADLEQQVDVRVDEGTVKTLTMHPGWRVFTVAVPAEAAYSAGSTCRFHGTMNLPISTGTVVIEVSRDGTTWTSVASTIPVRGRFSCPVTLDSAGTVLVRPSWSGSGYYKQTVGEPLEILVAAPPTTSTQAPASTTSETAAPPGSGGGQRPENTEDGDSTQKTGGPGWYVPVLAVVGAIAVATLTAVIVIRRKRRPAR